MENKLTRFAAPAARTDGPAASAETRTPFAVSEDYHRVLAAAYEHLLNRIDEEQIDVDAWSPVTVARFVHAHTERFVQEWRVPVNAAEMEIVAAALVRELTGFGPLDELLRDPDIDHILINGHKDVHITRGGERMRANQRFTDDDHVLRVLRRILSPLGLRLDDDNPVLDARLPGGAHLTAIIPPMALDGPVISIHTIRRQPLSGDDLLRLRMFDAAMHALLRAMVAGRCNILVSGGNSSGRTSLLNALASDIPAGQRVVTLEETAELTLEHPLLVRLECQRSGGSGQRSVSTLELVRNSRRMRPDRLIVGEARGAELLELLPAMGSDCSGSMATLHASSAQDCLHRLELLAGAAGFAGSQDSLRRQIADAVDVIVHVTRLDSGRRVVASITEVSGVDANGIQTRDLFRHEPQLAADGTVTDHWLEVALPRNGKLAGYRPELRDAVAAEARPSQTIPT